MKDTVFNIEPMCFDNSEVLLSNPNRGLRMEAYITLGESLCAYPKTKSDPYKAIDDFIIKYKEDSPKLCQLYVYLSNYRRNPLDELAFTQFKRVLEQFKNNDIRVLLRFAYATESVPDASYRFVKMHLSQIKAWFNANQELINDTLYCLQTGIIGYWGEGHSYKNLLPFYIPKVINAVCDLAPKGIYTQVRFYKMLDKVKPNNTSIVGFHDDYIVGDLNHKWAIAPISNQKLFNSIMEKGKYTVNDGEMPWGYAHYNDDEKLDLCDSLNGADILKQLNIYHLTSFSLEHNYREKGGYYSMHKWKSKYLSYDECISLGVGVNPNLFKNANGENIKLSIYDIIRYHLGYQLVLSNCYVKDNGFTFKIANYGFAAPLCFNYLAVVVENNGVIKEIEIADYDKTKLQPNTTVSYNIKLKNDCKIVGIKLDTFKDRGVNVHFANVIDYKNGVNILLKK